MKKKKNTEVTIRSSAAEYLTMDDERLKNGGSILTEKYKEETNGIEK